MAKKKPKQTPKAKKPISPERPVTVITAKERKPEFELIRFDKKVNIFIAACLVLFALFVTLKWHNSSIPYWNKMAYDGGSPERGLLVGEPRSIRSDEWLVVSSFIVAQNKKGFPVSNEALGYGKAPLTAGLPTNHLLSILKPLFWGYYLLDIERGFSWHWNFKIFPFLIASFLFFMLFTQNQFLLSLFGSLWFFLSSAIQWWSINTEIFTYGLTSVTSFIYVLYATKPKTILISGVFFTLSSYCFAMVLYPAYQVPLAYFLLALIVGYMLKHKVRLKVNVQLNWKLLTLGCSLALLMILGYVFYHISKDTIDVITNTVYPGKRNEHGGDYSFLRIFSDNFNLFMDMKIFPPSWGNICEVSSFLMLFPLASILIVGDFIKTKKTNPILLSLLAYQILIFLWLFVGFPEILAKVSLFNMSPSYRTMFVFGAVNVISTILFLSHYRNSMWSKNIFMKLITFIILFFVTYGINYYLNQRVKSFFTPEQVIEATLIFSILSWLVIHYNENKIFQYAFGLGCFLFIAPNMGINPLSKGLSPFYQNEFFKMVSNINAKDPNAGWAVFGNCSIATYLKSTGINCFDGVQFAPPLEKLRILDPTMKKDSIYNRYAHIAMSSFITGTDSVNFVLKQSDFYTIEMDPCSPRMEQLGVEYCLFTYYPDPREVECMNWVTDTLGMYIFKRGEL